MHQVIWNDNKKNKNKFKKNNIIVEEEEKEEEEKEEKKWVKKMERKKSNGVDDKEDLVSGRKKQRLAIAKELLNIQLLFYLMKQHLLWIKIIKLKYRNLLIN